jgi:CelD/BcsL family acetyltransferase involved in cellulose biosynthesis
LPLEITLIPGHRLNSEQVAIWRQLQQSNPELANPCFSPEFAQAVAAVRSDVEVALIAQGREVVGIFSFQRKGRSRGVPTGGIVSDYQGLICRPGFTCDPLNLLKACGLIAWDFDRLLASQNSFIPYHRLCEPSAQIDLSDGYQSYVGQRRAAGTHQINHCDYMMRRMEREIGPLRFVPHSSDPKLLAQVLAWKSQQYRRSGWRDLFATGWGRALVEHIHATHTTAFAGMLSLLYAGQQLVAGHLGMRSDSVWHYWFPAFDRQFGKFSPGLILLMKMAQYAEELGLRSIDVGTGITLYKKRLMNASLSVAEGSVERPSCLRALRSARRKVKSVINGFLRSARRQ